MSLVDALEIVDRNLSLIFLHLQRDESGRPGSLSAQSAKREQKQSQTQAASNSGVVFMSNTPWSSVPASPGTTQFPDFLD